MEKEAVARIKIDKLLQESGWRFFDSEEGKLNVVLEDRVTLKKVDINDLGEDYEKTSNGFMDYLLLGPDGKPLIIIEAKKSSINPLEAQNQAKNYAKGKKVNYVILSNGNIHYFWNLKKNEMKTISSFPKCKSIIDFKSNKETLEKRKKKLIEYKYDEFLIAESQDPKIPNKEREKYCKENGLLKLRSYQKDAIDKLICSIKEKKEKFLFEMATGTGKTLVAASVIKLFLKSGFTDRILFLVDRIDLEKQAFGDFKEYFQGDGNIQIGIYKENRTDWRDKNILVTTIQSIVKDDRYKKNFSELDFGLIITDEAHRSISGATNRELFKYFEGFKLGLTATPKSFLKNIDQIKLKQNKPLELEERRERDTYAIFGCENGTPTFVYNLKQGVDDQILTKPILIDDRTLITTDLLSREGLSFNTVDEEGNELEETFFMKHFEKRFFSEKTNRAICRDFLKRSKKDPITGEIGKTIMFCVSQEHALKIKNILNKLAEEELGYPADNNFAERITSNELEGNSNSKKFTHKHNNLNGKYKHPNEGIIYNSSKTRVCTTVSMMSTGYNCKDLLNIVMFRPIYSPSEFIQIKGRGTRLYDFVSKGEDGDVLDKVSKNNFHLFDFFGVCEYFEKKYDFEKPEKLIMPSNGIGEGEKPTHLDATSSENDKIISSFKKEIGSEGFIVDQKGFSGVTSKDKSTDEIIRLYESDKFEEAEETADKLFEKLNFTKNRFRKIFNIKRIPTIKDIYSVLKKGKPQTDKEYFDEKFQEFDFQISFKPELEDDVKDFFEAYCFDPEFRNNVDSGNLTKINDLRLVSVINKIKDYKEQITNYVMEKDIYLE
jgi:type I restriction enzyme, R subunit